MPLIARIAPNHTIRTFRAAAKLRYDEACGLAHRGDRLAAIYLWGYCAEMLFKAAYFRLIGWAPGQLITLTDLNQAKSHAIHHLGLHWHSNLHDLTRWRELLVEERKIRMIPYEAIFSRALNARVNRIFLNWREYLRYRVNNPYQGEVAAVFQAVHWLLGQYNHL
jgi:hypothetical protein